MFSLSVAHSSASCWVGKKYTCWQKLLQMDSTEHVSRSAKFRFTIDTTAVLGQVHSTCTGLTVTRTSFLLAGENDTMLAVRFNNVGRNSVS